MREIKSPIVECCFVICALIWNIFIIAGSVYLVGWQGWSLFTFIATAYLLVSNVTDTELVKHTYEDYDD